MRLIMSWFTCIPYAVFAVASLAFVCTCRFRWRTRLAWLAVLLACNLKFWFFRHFGGHALQPELPEPLIWLWDWAYIGSAFLAVLAVPCMTWRGKAKAWVLPAVAWGASALGLWNALTVPRVREETFVYDSLPAELDGYRIAQVADLHCCSAARRWRTQRVVDLVNSLDADLVCLLGDNVDGLCADRFDDLLPLRELRAKDGVWSVTGNHEYYREPEMWFSAYERLGLRFLKNACVFPRPSLALGGVNDREVYIPWKKTWYGDAPDVAHAFAAATNGEFRVLMQHRPEGAPENCARHHVDLQLSGHTHGGFMPLVSRLVAQVNAGFIDGVHDFGGRRLCITNGAGQTPGFMLRFFTPSEIVLITLRRL